MSGNQGSYRSVLAFGPSTSMRTLAGAWRSDWLTGMRAAQSEVESRAMPLPLRATVPGESRATSDLSAQPPVGRSHSCREDPARSPSRSLGQAEPRPERWHLCSLTAVLCSVRARTFVQCSLERVRGIEPPSSDWKSKALPLSYTRRWGHRTAWDPATADDDSSRRPGGTRSGGGDPTAAVLDAATLEGLVAVGTAGWVQLTGGIAEGPGRSAACQVVVEHRTVDLVTTGGG